MTDSDNATNRQRHVHDVEVRLHRSLLQGLLQNPPQALILCQNRLLGIAKKKVAMFFENPVSRFSPAEDPIRVLKPSFRRDDDSSAVFFTLSPLRRQAFSAQSRKF
ncbi:MAG: hypothetical protein LBJ46_10325 [Planctomycetota bacterium]|jgi:hypothetical protein|nr:hypothetical protein [Planctomycetota bacterium]